MNQPAGRYRLHYVVVLLVEWIIRCSRQLPLTAGKLLAIHYGRAYEWRSSYNKNSHMR